MAGDSRGTVVVWVVAAAVGVFGLMRLTGSGGEETGAPVRVERSPGGSAAPSRGGADGATLYVHVAGAVRRPGPGGGGGGAGGPPGVKPSLGSATVEQLDEVDGIGPTLAERIVEYRTANGGFSSVDELQDVDGIGEKRLETLREALQP